MTETSSGYNSSPRLHFILAFISILSQLCVQCSVRTEGIDFAERVVVGQRARLGGRRVAGGP